ncbi:predicted xylose isomerase-like protein [Alteracholeplasma palmae J233]|uniref:Predicted xylose isomerase-like protein n=1 Tax=Alteracholeplasma palmae (strain ATCC 49389 / J233) TaxID=1318466 RepID=U4KKF4_ALTPJ|nr:sugar phosphate isomerase/epimerase family protein [Alteracholeplasma palmae]CCV64204.1 predicted xylose isomerase-like protein [Alteracholeplasma palmae J233]
MFKLGVRAHDIGKYSAKELSEHVLSYGFEGVQLVFKKAIDTPVDFNDLTEIKKYFGTKPEIFMLGAYFNPVHPDLEIRNEGIEYFKRQLEIANSLNAKFVGSETGSLMGTPWGYMPENHTQETLDKVIEVFKDLSLTAEKNNSYIAIEGAYPHVASTPERVKEIVDKINSPHLKVTVDLYNFLNLENYENRMEILDRSLALLKEHIVIFHLKDFVIEGEKLKQVGLGKGLMDYKAIIKRIKEEVPSAYLIFEGVKKEDLQESYELISSLIK